MELSFNVQEELGKCKDFVEINGLLKRMLKEAAEQILEAEMDNHPGYEKHSAGGKNSGNSRNGKNKKTVVSDMGEFELKTPRDRNGEFEHKLIKKRQTDISDIDEKVISMYARGMTTRDIQSHFQEIYGAEISPAEISMITDKVLGLSRNGKADR
jgi:transposase-like protein